MRRTVLPLVLAEGLVLLGAVVSAEVGTSARGSLAGIKSVSVYVSVASNLPSAEQQEFETTLRPTAEARLRSLGIVVKDWDNELLVTLSGSAAPPQTGVVFLTLAVMSRGNGR